MQIQSRSIDLPSVRPPRRSLLRIRRVLALGALAVIVLAGGGLSATSAAAEGYTYDLAGELMSPFCPGRTLKSCPSPQAAELIQWISVQESAGVSRDEVVEILVAQWGDEILGAPPAEGITLWAYIVPAAGIIGGAGLAILVIRNLVGGAKRAEPARAPTAPPDSVAQGAAPGSVPSDEELARIVQQELAARS